MFVSWQENEELVHANEQKNLTKIPDFAQKETINRPTKINRVSVTAFPQYLSLPSLHEWFSSRLWQDKPLKARYGRSTFLFFTIPARMIQSMIVVEWANESIQANSLPSNDRLSRVFRSLLTL